MTNDDEMWMLKALRVSLNSPDPSRKTGAVIVRDGSSVATGWNSFTPGVEVTDVRLARPLKYLFMEHAERVAIALSARKGISLEGCRMVLPWFPCTECSRAIVLSGISSLLAVEPDWSEERYHFRESREILVKGGVEVEYFESDSLDRLRERLMGEPK
jgi:dCMP deaminase